MLLITVGFPCAQEKRYYIHYGKVIANFLGEIRRLREPLLLLVDKFN